MPPLPAIAETSTPRSPLGESVLSLGILGAIAVMLVPLPTLVLDLLLALNLGVTILLLLVTLSTRRAMDLSVFPALLLLLTLGRLALNVATTRLILLSGNAGELVAAFGGFVVGGNVVVGLVIFLILVVIQFVVITKGAGRISEVAARFTLDALPGKQMAIDAELNSGAIDDVTARQRRKALARETEFYGAMDGASKFVRGDAVAGLIITAINLLGGIIIGVRGGLSLADSLRTYSILTVGDGLLSQIPALIIATTAGMLTTKASSEESLGGEISDQMLRSDQPLWMAAGLFGGMALLPGVPHLPFLMISGTAAGIVLHRRRTATTAGAAVTPFAASTPAEPAETGTFQEYLLTDRATVEVGPGLMGLLAATRGKGLGDRIGTLRRDLSRDHGLWIPPLRVRSNLELPPARYRVLIGGREVGSGDLRPDEHLAILPEGRQVSLPGVSTAEPVFKLPAIWISPTIARQAEAQGCTVVDAPSVLITHLSELLQRHAPELLSRESLKQMLDALKSSAPTVLDEIRTETVRLGTIHQVLMQLIEDRVPLSDLALILESIVNHAPGKKSVDDLCDAVRGDLGPLLCARHADAEGQLQMLALQPPLEARLRESLVDGQLALAATALSRLLAAMGDRVQTATLTGSRPALVVHHTLRRPLKRLLRRALPSLGYLAFREIPPDMAIHPVGLVRWEDVYDASVELPGARSPGNMAAAA